MPYASAASLQAYLSQTENTAPNVALFDAICDRATDIVRAALASMLADPAFDLASYGTASTTIVRGYATDLLPLPPHQAGSVTLVEYQSASNPAAYTTVADQWLAEGAALYRAGGWGRERYRVTAVWGYGPVPAAVEEVTLEVAVNLWRSRDKGGFTETIGVDGQGGIRVVSGLTKQQQAILERVAQRWWQP